MQADDENKALNRGISVRRLQQKCKLTQLQTECVAQALEENGSGTSNLRGAAKKMKLEAGVSKYFVLHGCVKVHDNGEHCKHVYGPQDKNNRCPQCGHARYKENSKQPNEKVYWFPLEPRLRALLKLPSYRRLLQV